MASSKESLVSVKRFYAAITLVALVWGITIFHWTGLSFDLIPKLLPRTVNGLFGIFTMPFLHADMNHLLSNTLPLITLSLLISLQGSRYFSKSTFLIIIISGAMLWLMGRSLNHIGASGLIFGYFGFLLLRLYYSPNIITIVISIGVLFVYGGILYGVLPQGGYISWEGHLFGFIAGIIVARIMKRDVGG